jgi:ABC-type bacteriocin/lantibiotic exporter with double-glycine peptidase domain
MRSSKAEPPHGGAWRGSGGRLIIRILRRYRFKVTAILMATLGVYAAGLAVPVVTQNIIDGITSGWSTAFTLTLGFLAVACAAIDVALADIRRSMIIDLGQRVDRQISLEIMTHVLGSRLDTGSHTTGETLNRTEQTDKIKGFLIDLIPGAIFDIGGAVIATILIFAYSVFCGLSILLIAAGGFLLANSILHTYHANVSFQFKLTNEKQGYLAETVGGLPTIKALAIEPGRFRLWVAKIKRLITAEGKTAHILRRFHRVTRLSQHMLTLAVVGVGGIQMLHGDLSVGDLFAILMLTAKVSMPLLGAADVARQYQEVAVAVKELGVLLDVPPDRANVSLPVRPPLSGATRFHNVIYRYGGGATPAIAGLSLQLPEAGLIAIIGRNGSGKTTILRMLQGFLRDFEGEVSIGGVDVRSYHPRWLRSQMAVVNQDTILFAGTIRENVSCWASGVADREIEAALRLAGAWEFVEKLPDQVNARLIENGANLSGGQRQRLSIARAVLREPKVILLDEPTAFLDAEAAVNLEARLCAWGKGRLMILVTHHLAAARLAETIILLDEGKVAAQGSHNELLGSSALYRSLWNDYLRGSGVEHAPDYQLTALTGTGLDT